MLSARLLGTLFILSCLLTEYPLHSHSLGHQKADIPWNFEYTWILGILGTHFILSCLQNIIWIPWKFSIVHRSIAEVLEFSHPFSCILMYVCACICTALLSCIIYECHSCHEAFQSPVHNYTIIAWEVWARSSNDWKYSYSPNGVWTYDTWLASQCHKTTIPPRQAIPWNIK